MRTAAIARAWHKGKIERGLSIHRTHLDDAQAAAVVLFGGMGYRSPYPRNADEAGDRVVTDEAEFLATTDLYVVSPQMGDVVVAAAQSLTIEDLKLVDGADIPSPTGLVVLPQPLLVAKAGGALSDDRAYTWRAPWNMVIPGSRASKWKDLAAVRVSVYQDSHGPV
jgi:hypothetical protein